MTHAWIIRGDLGRRKREQTVMARCCDIANSVPYHFLFECPDSVFRSSDNRGVLLDFGLSTGYKKKKEKILFGSILKDPPLFATLNGTPVERVTTFKLLRVQLANDLKWMQHVDAISLKVSSRLLPKAA